MLNKFFLLLTFSFGSLLMNAQVKVSGKIISSDLQHPISGANITLKNLPQTITFSDENGYFEISSEQFSDTLIIGSIGKPYNYIPLKKGDNLNLVIDIIKENNQKKTLFSNTTTHKVNNTEIINDSVKTLSIKINNNIDSLINSDTLQFVKVSGKIINEETKQPIVDADIYLKNTSYYTFSDENGYFELNAPYYIDSLEISAPSFPTKYIQLKRGENLNLSVNFSKKDNSSVKSKTTTIDEITVVGFPPKKLKKKENPAYRILKELWKRRRTNGLTNFKNYQYKEYEKIEFDLNNIDSAFISKNLFKKLNISTTDIDTLDISGKTYIPVFINESISSVIGKNDPYKSEKNFLEANQTSGIPNNEIVSNTVKNLYKEVNIYDNVLNFFNKGFTSPVATIGFSVYEYMLTDTVDVNGAACYHIKYRPLRANELTFKGDLYITKDTYAVKQVSLQSSSGINVNFVKDIYMELNYDSVNDSIFIPTRNYTVLDMSLLSKKNKTKGMFAKRTLTYNDYKFDQPENDVESLLNRQWEPVSAGAYHRGAEFWDNNRPTELSEDDKKAYALVEKVSKTKLFKNIINGVQIFSSGYINIKKSIDFGNLYESIGSNNVEGFRIRAGARTYFGANDMWRLEGYSAYGFKDNQFKYGGEGRYMFNKYNRFIIGGGTKRDITQLGVSLTEGDGIMTRSFASSSIFSRGSNEFLSNVNKTGAFISFEPWKNVQLRLDGTYQYIKSANPAKFNIGYYDRNGNVKQDLYDTHLTLSVMLRPGAIYSGFGVDRYEHTTLAPTIILKYIKGFDGVLNSGFNYDKLQFLYNQPILFGPIGKTNVTFEFGKSFNKLPLSLLSIIPGNQSYGIIPNTFSQLDYYDFVTDIYSALHLEHHFNGRIFSYIPLLKKLQFREIVFFRGAWGDISKGSINMNASNIKYVAPKNDIYYEYGFGIENIGFGNLRVFRVDFNWRGNYLDMPDASKFGVKAGMQFTF